MGPWENPRGVAVARRVLYFYLSGWSRGLIRHERVRRSMLWAAIVASVALLLVSAKTHGRQLRLERELQGYHTVVFGGENPAWVEARWRQDRIGFWTIVPVAALALGWLAWPHGWALRLTAALLWAPIVGFVAMGLASQVRLARALDAKSAEQKEERTGWIREARRGSAIWWALVVVLVPVVAALLRV